MKLRFGRVNISSGFLLLLAWLFYWDEQGIVPAVLTACFLHELGHWTALHLLGITVKDINVTAIGAEMIYGGSLPYMGECAVAAAGPAVNLFLAGMFSRFPGGELFAGVNVALAAFNLLPVGQLDGGRVIGCLLSVWAGPDAAEKMSRAMEWLLVVPVFLLGVWIAATGKNITLLLVSAWLLSGTFGGKYGKRVVIRKEKG